MKKIIFTAHDKKVLEEQMKNLSPDNYIDLDKLIQQTKTEEEKIYETYYYSQSTSKALFL
ncbi:hypothetical protein QAY99_10575 [Glaesserella parasuis]|uniref:hypothetical protein n=1 Tax=Glaesserella parasuis TaxID=738 RepID=UPI0024370816|nr:hypothetical protein [Glaesserella parasuis]MDG6234092.1 hypothetical protein [Glaesserella parasuis]MDG6449161.1 hypothetical protein [Glaesserella parasuis]MDP0344784.1 hypothetical protein [Glaesserella parasuis]